MRRPAESDKNLIFTLHDKGYSLNPSSKQLNLPKNDDILLHQEKIWQKDSANKDRPEIQ